VAQSSALLVTWPGGPPPVGRRQPPRVPDWPQRGPADPLRL